MAGWTCPLAHGSSLPRAVLAGHHGRHCIIQAKRYRGAVGVEPGTRPAGVMDDKHATTGILVTASWVTKDGHDFAQRHGRIRLIECAATGDAYSSPGPGIAAPNQKAR